MNLESWGRTPLFYLLWRIFNLANGKNRIFGVYLIWRMANFFKFGVDLIWRIIKMYHFWKLCYLHLSKNIITNWQYTTQKQLSIHRE